MSQQHARLVKNASEFKLPKMYSHSFGLSPELAAKAASDQLTPAEERECNQQIDDSMKELRGLYEKYNVAKTAKPRGTGLHTVRIYESVSTHPVVSSELVYNGRW